MQRRQTRPPGATDERAHNQAELTADNKGPCAQAQSTEERRLFRAAVADALSTVTAQSLLIDTVQVRVKRPLSPNLARELTRLNGDLRETVFDRKQISDWRFIIRLTRPSGEALDLLAHNIQEHIINRCDVALDLWTESSKDADAVSAFLARHLCQPWHGKRRYVQISNTTYFAGPWQGRNVVIYAKNRPPRCRLEIRLFGVASCRRYGISSLAQIQMLDLMAIINRNVRFAKPSRRSIERHTKRAIMATMQESGLNRHDATRLVTRVLCRRLQQEDRVITDLRDAAAQRWIEEVGANPRAVITLGDILINTSILSSPM